MTAEQTSLLQWSSRILTPKENQRPMAAANKKLARSPRTAKSQGMFNQRQQKQITSAFNVLNEVLPQAHKQRDIEMPEGFDTMPSQIRVYGKWFLKNLAEFGRQRAQQAVNGNAPRTSRATATSKRSRVKAASSGGAGPGGQTHAATS
jgi:hypothetical protein